MQTTGVGIIGYGLSGSTFHAPVIARTPGLRVAAIVSSQRQKAAADWPDAKLYADVPALLRDPAVSLVIVCSPNALHYDHARQALEAGRPVVVEKPFTVSLTEADALIELAARRGLLLSVYHNRRWDGDFLTLRQLIDAGALGVIQQYESRFDRFRPQVGSRWRELDQPGGGLLYDLGPHLVDQALLLFGPPDSVQADLARQRLHAQVDDWFQLSLAWGERRALLSAGSLVREPGPRFLVQGDQASFRSHGLDPQENALRSATWPLAGRPETVDQASWPTLTGGQDRLDRRPIQALPGDYGCFYRAILAALAGREPNPVPAEAARLVMKLLDTARRSAQEGRRLPFTA